VRRGGGWVGAYGGVLAEVAEADGGRDNEEEGGDAGEDCEGLGEVLRLFHFGDEGWEEDLEPRQPRLRFWWCLDLLTCGTQRN